VKIFFSVIAMLFSVGWMCYLWKEDFPQGVIWERVIAVWVVSLVFALLAIAWKEQHNAD